MLSHPHAALVKALRETGLGRAPGSTIEVVDPHTTMVEGKPLVAVVDGAIGVIVKNIRQAALGQEITGKVTMEGHQDYEVRPRKAGTYTRRPSSPALPSPLRVSA